MTLLDKVRTYKSLLSGSAYNLFDGVMVTKVSGCSFDGRQKNLERVEDSTPLKLVRDRRNEHDFHAVSVHAFVNGSWEDVGFLPSKVNKDVALAMDSGIKMGVKVWRKTGGGEDGYYHGLSITVKREED